MYPVCESCLVLLCPALMSLLNINLSLYPRLRVPVPPSCVHRDRRPDLNRKRRPFTPVLVCRFEKFYFVPVFVYVCPAAWKSPLVIPAIAHCKSAWEFGGITASAASPLACEPSCPPIAGDIRRRRSVAPQCSTYDPRGVSWIQIRWAGVRIQIRGAESDPDPRGGVGFPPTAF